VWDYTWSGTESGKNRTRPETKKCLTFNERTWAEGMSSRVIDDLNNARVIATEERYQALLDYKWVVVKRDEALREAERAGSAEQLEIYFS
jgi:hypothetical protein